MRYVRRGWPRALSARRLVLLATVAGLGVAGATIGPNALHQAGLPTYAAANAAEIARASRWDLPTSSKRSNLPSYRCASKWTLAPK